MKLSCARLLKKPYILEILKKYFVANMSLRFRGGERLQRGRGIGGLLRLAKSLFFPVVKTIGKTAIKAANSKVGKQAIKAVKEQAIDSAINLAGDVLLGNDMGVGLQREFEASKEKAVEALDEIQKTRQLNAQLNKKKVKRSQVKKKIFMGGKGYLSDPSK